MKALFLIDEDQAKLRIAKRIAREFSELSVGCPLFVNLGVGIPTMVAEHVDSENVFLQAENGMLGVGPAAKPGQEHADLINAGRVKVTETAGCAYFDSAMSFGMIRGGHIDATVIGAFEVDEQGNVANWIIPNGKQLGVGGAMDLVSGARKVYIAMQHVNKKGQSKVIPRCTLPVTGYGEVDVLVTEYALFRFLDGKMILEELAPELSLDELRSITPAAFSVSPNLCPLC